MTKSRNKCFLSPVDLRDKCISVCFYRGGGESDLHEAAAAGLHQWLHGRRQCHSARGAFAAQLVPHAADAARPLQSVPPETYYLQGTRRAALKLLPPKDAAFVECLIIDRLIMNTHLVIRINK